MDISAVFNLPVIEAEICLLDEVRIHFDEMTKIFNKRTNRDIIRGKYLLHIVDAAWRIREGKKIILTNADDNEDKCNEFTKYLKKRTIIAYRELSVYDCMFVFDNNAIFETFFNQIDIDEPVKWLIDKPDGTTYYHEILQ
jgi:hypothetical protein